MESDQLRMRTRSRFTSTMEVVEMLHPGSFLGQRHWLTLAMTSGSAISAATSLAIKMLMMVPGLWRNAGTGHMLKSPKLTCLLRLKRFSRSQARKRSRWLLSQRALLSPCTHLLLSRTTGQTRWTDTSLWPLAMSFQVWTTRLRLRSILPMMNLDTTTPMVTMSLLLIQCLHASTQTMLS